MNFKLQRLAASCVWLASKLEENPRKPRHVVLVFHRMECRRENLPIQPLDLGSKVCLSNLCYGSFSPFHSLSLSLYFFWGNFLLFTSSCVIFHFKWTYNYLNMRRDVSVLHAPVNQWKKEGEVKRGQFCEIILCTILALRFLTNSILPKPQCKLCFNYIIIFMIKINSLWCLFEYWVCSLFFSLSFN